MKKTTKLVASIAAMMMVLALASCKSKEEKLAEQLLKELETNVVALETAAKTNDGETFNTASAEVERKFSELSSLVKENELSESIKASYDEVAKRIETAQDSAPVSEKDFLYKLALDGNGIIITQYNGLNKTLKIPETIEGLPVVVIAKIGNKVVKNIVIPKNVIALGDKSFQGCNQLKKVTLSEGLEVIGDMAFDGLNSLESINFPTTLKAIGTRAFRGTSLKNVELKEGLLYVGYSAFDCWLDYISIPKTFKGMMKQNSNSHATLASLSKNADLSKIVIPEDFNISIFNSSYARYGNKTLSDIKFLVPAESSASFEKMLREHTAQIFSYAPQSDPTAKEAQEFINTYYKMCTGIVTILSECR